MARLILVLNAGSSSLKASLVVDGSDESAPTESAEWDDDRATTLDAVLRTLHVQESEVRAVAHRVVHGGAQFSGPVVIGDRVIDEIEQIADLAPLHNIVALELIRLARSRLPHVAHVACFDTAFHATIPEVAWRYPVPYEWAEAWGIRRFGFHGLSVEWSVRKSAELLGRSVDHLSLVVAHLGSGCSITAVENGRSKWTSMGFTPLEGVMMATRSGSVDPGVLIHLVQTGRAGVEEVADALEQRSGLLGVSEVSADIRDVRKAAQAGNERAALALQMFAARAAEGGAAAMTWVVPDAIVFTGGIGEHDEEMRAEILGRVRVASEIPVLTIEAREDLVMAAAALGLVGP